MNNSNVPNAYLPGFLGGMVAANCVNVNRAAMWCAQIGHESVGLKYMEEIASGEAYNGRKDLGNTQPGDGPRFKGRGPIQLTGRINYLHFGQWCLSHNFVNDANYFINSPLQVASPIWGFLAASWYWVVQRPQINALCDQGDIKGVTQAINGGQNGISDRTSRWNSCLRLGVSLLPNVAPVGPSNQQKLFLV
jgi:predicted chitinase